MKKVISVILSIFLLLTGTPASFAAEQVQGESSEENQEILQLMMSDIPVTRENFEETKSHLSLYGEIITDDTDKASIERYLYVVSVKEDKTQDGHIQFIPLNLSNTNVEDCDLVPQYIIAPESSGENPENIQSHRLSVQKADQGSDSANSKYIIAFDRTVESSEEDKAGEYTIRCQKQSIGSFGQIFFRVKTLDEEQGENPDIPEDKPGIEDVNTGICTKAEDGSYELIPYYNQGFLEQEELPVQMFFKNKNTDEFYILLKSDNTQAEPTPRIKEIGNGGFAVPGDVPCEVRKVSAYETGGRYYAVWQVKVTNNLDYPLRTGVYFWNEEDDEERRPDLVVWMLGDGYAPADWQMAQQGDLMCLMSELPKGTVWDTKESFEMENKGLLAGSDPYNIYNINLSENDNKNTFYIMYPAGSKLQAAVTKYYGYEGFGGSSRGSGQGGEFEKILNDESIEIKSLNKTITIGEKSYQFAEAYLTGEAYKGHENIRITFEAKENESTERSASYRVEFTKGMNIEVKGERGVEAIRDAGDILHAALGIEPLPEPMAWSGKDGNNGKDKAYFADAFSVFDSAGQGNDISLAVEMKNGYVIESIEDANGKPYDFSIRHQKYYKVMDGGDTEIDYENADWQYGVSSRDENHTLISALATATTLAEQENGKLIGMADDSNTQDSDFYKYLDNHQYTAEKRGDFLEYYIDMNSSDADGRTMVIKVKKYKADKKVRVYDGDRELTSTVQPVSNFDYAYADKALESLSQSNASVEKVFDISADTENVSGLINATVPSSELKGNPTDYTVMYVRNGVPMEVPTTAAESGSGLIFTTGHFSQYALVKTGGNPITPEEPGSKPPYIPPTELPVQKPIIEAEEGAEVRLSEDGKTAEITVEEGAVLKEVFLNGKSMGAVTKIENLKTGDKLTVIVETASEKEERLIKGVKNTKIKLYYKKDEIGKGWIKLRFKKSYGYKVDRYEIFRSAKKKTNFGEKAWFVTKTNKTRGYYKNEKNVKKGTRYYYKMRGTRKIGEKIYYTNWSNTVMRTGK